ncbi:MAG: uncharacterized protein KVP18_001178 [Porospora cf. gigantea A]|nr:MAG: hypothetical protein KVP18_001178 [Porospora cf. gigantea A]
MVVNHPWPPVVPPQARVLVLGSMPSPLSLEKDFFYGHNRNAFWFIIDALLHANTPSKADTLSAASVTTADAPDFDFLALEYTEDSEEFIPVARPPAPLVECCKARKHAALHKLRIALWDVCSSCRRVGASDGTMTDVLPNDFETLFKQHPTIEHVVFNGKSVQSLWKRHVEPQQRLPPLTYHMAPSTSPAYACLCIEEKVQQWVTVLQRVIQPNSTRLLGDL